MKIVVRQGVFETNSSSTHTLALVSKTDYEADKQTAKPKLRKYGVIDNKYDKLLMACGCCEEIFATEEEIDSRAQWDDEFSIQRKQFNDKVKAMLASGEGCDIAIDDYKISCEVAISFIVRVYCELTSEDYDTVYSQVDSVNKSGRACHKKFFEEGALTSARWDYRIIKDLFSYKNESQALASIRRYFDDGFVLCYREYYAGIRDDDDDDGEADLFYEEEINFDDDDE